MLSIRGHDRGAARTADRVSAEPCRHLHLWRRGGWRKNGRADPGAAAPRQLGSRISPPCSSGARRPQITNPGGLWDESQNFYPRLGGTPHVGMREWRWPRAGKIKFSHLQFETTVYDWQGAQITLICFDELTHFTAHQFFYMVSRNRSTCGVRPYIRATCNPDADSWVADFLAWWIDPESGLPIPERAGVAALLHPRRGEDRLGRSARRVDAIPATSRRTCRRASSRRGRSASPSSRRRCSTTRSCCGSTPNISLGCCRCRRSSASGCWAAIGRSGRPPGSISSGSGAPSSTRSRPISTSCAIGISPPPKRPSSTIPIGRSASSSAATGTAATGCWIWCARGPTRATSSTCCSIPPTQDGKRVRIGFGQDPGQAGKSQALHLVRALSGFTVTPAPESGDKLTRFGPFSSQCRAGNVKIRRGAWNEELFRVLEGFPDLAHDDEVDACSGALEMLNPQMKSWGIYEFDAPAGARAQAASVSRTAPKPIGPPARWNGKPSRRRKQRPKSRQLRWRARLARLRADRIPKRRESGQDPDMDGGAVSQPKLIVVRERCDLCVDTKT